MKKSQNLKKKSNFEKKEKRSNFIIKVKIWKKVNFWKSSNFEKKSNSEKVKIWKGVKIINVKKIKISKTKIKKYIYILDSYKKGEISTKPIGLNGGETRPLLLWFQMKWNNIKGRLKTVAALAVMISNEVKWQQGKTEYWWHTSQWRPIAEENIL